MNLEADYRILSPHYPGKGVEGGTSTVAERCAERARESTAAYWLFVESLSSSELDDYLLNPSLPAAFWDVQHAERALLTLLSAIQTKRVWREEEIVGLETLIQEVVAHANYSSKALQLKTISVCVHHGRPNLLRNCCTLLSTYSQRVRASEFFPIAYCFSSTLMARGDCGERMADSLSQSYDWLIAPYINLIVYSSSSHEGSNASSVVEHLVNCCHILLLADRPLIQARAATLLRALESGRSQRALIADADLRDRCYTIVRRGVQSSSIAIQKGVEGMLLLLWSLEGTPEGSKRFELVEELLTSMAHLNHCDVLAERPYLLLSRLMAAYPPLKCEQKRFLAILGPHALRSTASRLLFHACMAAIPSARERADLLSSLSLRLPCEPESLLQLLTLLHPSNEAIERREAVRLFVELMKQERFHHHLDCAVLLIGHYRALEEICTIPPIDSSDQLDPVAVELAQLHSKSLLCHFAHRAAKAQSGEVEQLLGRLQRVEEELSYRPPYASALLQESYATLYECSATLPIEEEALQRAVHAALSCTDRSALLEAIHNVVRRWIERCDTLVADRERAIHRTVVALEQVDLYAGHRHRFWMALIDWFETALRSDQPALFIQCARLAKRHLERSAELGEDQCTFPPLGLWTDQLLADRSRTQRIGGSVILAWRLFAPEAPGLVQGEIDKIRELLQ